MNDIARSYIGSLSARTLFRRSALWSAIGPMRGMTVLDVGCGAGGPASFIFKREGVKAIGLDIFMASLIVAGENDAYQEFVCGDATFLPFRDNCVEASGSVATLEHLDRQGGEKLLRELERVAKSIVVVCCPVGSWGQAPCGDNQYQEHKYVWSLDELRREGFTNIRGIGLKGMSGKIWGKIIRSPVGPVLGLLSLAGTLLSCRNPRIASNVVCWKHVKCFG